jgi:hypothetical protein
MQNDVLEAMAKALHQHDVECNTGIGRQWSFIVEWRRQDYRDKARAALREGLIAAGYCSLEKEAEHIIDNILQAAFVK